MAFIARVGLILCAVGTALANPDLHIIGGEEANPIGRWKWQGSLQSIWGGHSCGCSLISPRWVVTAAHCVRGKTANQIKVAMGLHDRQDKSKGAPKDYYVAQIISHPGYQTGRDDIAVLKLQSDVTMNEYVGTVKLAPANTNFDNKDCYITGWGVTTIGGSSPARVLQQAAVKAFSNSFCKNYWWSINAGHICCGIIGQRGSCFGDSGGPLVCDLGSGYLLAGVTSFGNRNCDPADDPSVYTRVSYYRSWIKEKTGI